MLQTNTNVLVTGVAGFIGFHTAKRLLENGEHVVGLDNLNDYYSQTLKQDRLAVLKQFRNFTFSEAEIGSKEHINNIFKENKIDVVIHLAAQAGVRYSISNPDVYMNSNITGFFNVIEACRHFKIEHLIFASSSSVYGANKKMPFSTNDRVDHPISLYAATKKSNELIAHTYSHLFQIPTTGLRFFTVYGPYGRPDMAMYIFTKAILEGKPIDVYNYGKMKRDFTYVDDIVEGIIRLIPKPPKPNPSWDPFNPDASSSSAPYKIYNIGNNQPVELGYFIDLIEKYTGKKAVRNYLPLQEGDVLETYADISDLEKAINFKPQTSIEKGVEQFVKWYKEYHQIT